MDTRCAISGLLMLCSCGTVAGEFDHQLQILIERGDYSAARQHIEDQRLDRPDDAALLNDLAAVETALGNWRNAEALLRGAIATDPMMEVVSANLNRIYAWRASVAYQNTLEQPGEPPPAPSLTLLTTVAGTGSGLERAQSPLPSPRNEVRMALHAWRDAWASRELAAYYDAYEADFSPRQGVDHAVWRELRRRRITQPTHIEVELEDVELRTFSGVAVVSFIQRYRSDTLHDKVQKTLIFTRQPAGWKIMRELVTP